MTYHVSEREVSVVITVDNGGFDVIDLDGRKVNVIRVQAIAVGTDLAEVTLIGPLYRANGKRGTKVARVDVYPHPGKTPGPDDDFIHWDRLPSVLAHLILDATGAQT